MWFWIRTNNTLPRIHVLINLSIPKMQTVCETSSLTVSFSRRTQLCVIVVCIHCAVHCTAFLAERICIITIIVVNIIIVIIIIIIIISALYRLQESL